MMVGFCVELWQVRSIDGQGIPQRLALERRVVGRFCAKKAGLSDPAVELTIELCAQPGKQLLRQSELSASIREQARDERVTRAIR